MMQAEKISFSDGHVAEIELPVQPAKVASVYPKRRTISVPKKKVYESLKRIFDFVLSTLALTALFPFLLMTALIIFIDDPHGSPIYISKRCGKNGKEFRFYKFRSMCAHADTMLDSLMDKNEADGPAFKIKDDPRITRVGRVIRKYSIDELPQLINVLVGDMSIVGPRPPIPREVARYDHNQMKRLTVKPGLTCYWQIQPKRNELQFNDWIGLDLLYIQNRSLSLDAKLILQTIMVVVKGDSV